MADGTKPLNPQQEAFVAAYLGEAHGNASEAARIAGYKKPGQYGHQLLKNIQVATRVKEHVANKFASADAVLQELADVALSEWRDHIEIIARDKTGKAIKVRMDLSNKVKALELLGKHHQLFVEKQEIDINVREHRRAVPQSTIDSILKPAGDNKRRAEA